LTGQLLRAAAALIARGFVAGRRRKLPLPDTSLQKIKPHWDDMLRLAGSLKLGRVPAAGIMRTLQVGERPTRLAQAIAEFGRIEATQRRAH
jgi:TnpA family transposase